jgi:hypothetical protein
LRIRQASSRPSQLNDYYHKNSNITSIAVLYDVVMSESWKVAE